MFSPKKHPNDNQLQGAERGDSKTAHWRSFGRILRYLAGRLGLITAMTTKYRDLRFLVSFGVSLLMYATPVIYQVSLIPERFQLVIKANPMTSIV